MNWTRKELKSRARRAIPKNYWKIFFITTLFFYISNGAILGNTGNTVSRIYSVINAYKSQDPQHKKELFALITVSGICLVIFNIVVKLVMDVFLTNPLRIGSCYFMQKTLKDEEKGQIRDLTLVFDSRYLQAIRVMLVRDLLVSAGLLLLIVPGIYLLYCYRMVPYLLSTDRDYTIKEVLQESRQMMNGQKKEAFLLDLSFVPLHFLGTITIGVAELFFVKPYAALTNAALFLKIYNGSKNENKNNENINNENINNENINNENDLKQEEN